MAFKLVVYTTLSAMLTWVVRYYALRNRIIAIPNARSSHTTPTPSGGGLAFVGLFLILMWSLPIERNTLMAMAGGVIVALVGWIDDRVSLPASLRALVHVIAACWALVWLGGFPPIDLGFTRVSLGVLGWPVGVIAVVWLINLYNFMDGIDGLAGGQAVIAGVAGGVLLQDAGLIGLSELAWTLAALALGFLIWNWAPAKIFMGDVASGFLGYAFSVLAIGASHQGGPPLVLWVLLLGVFIVDATATLMRRIRQGERWYEAHRSHAYQLAIQMGYSHAQVATVMLAISAVLGIITWVGWYRPVFMTPLTVVTLGGLYLAWRTVVVRGLNRQITSQATARVSATSMH